MESRMTLNPRRHSGMLLAGIQIRSLDPGSRPKACRDRPRLGDGPDLETCICGAPLGVLLVTILIGCTLVGCGHAPIHPDNMSSAPPSPYERSAEVRIPQDAAMESNRPMEDRYLYVTGYGKLPEGSSGQAQDWLRAKRAAIDDAYAKLLSEAGRDSAQSVLRTATPSSGSHQNPERSSGTAGQAEIVGVMQLPDGGCQVLMRAPLSNIKVRLRAISPPQEPQE